VPEVEEMATKIGVRLPKGKKKEQEVKAAIAKTSDRPYRDYSKQGALEVRPRPWCFVSMCVCIYMRITGAPLDCSAHVDGALTRSPTKHTI
jgi:hypothetical protein